MKYFDFQKNRKGGEKKKKKIIFPVFAWDGASISQAVFSVALRQNIFLFL